MYKISIAIPVFNREKELDELLNSIVYSLQKNNLIDVFQVVISDNASTDSTVFVASKYSNILNLKLYVQTSNVGPDRNYMKVSEMCDGEYIWFYGSDDLFPSNGLSQLYNRLIKSEADLVLMDRLEFYASNQQSDILREWLSSDAKSTYDFSEDSLSDYLNSCRSLGGVFSYLSSIIVSKDLWNDSPVDDDFIGTAYSHVDRIFSMILSKPNFKLFYEKSTVPLCRMGNDYFSSDGWYKRFMIDIDGYKKLANKHFIGLPSEKSYLLEILNKEHSLKSIVSVYRCTSFSEEIKRLISSLIITRFPLWKIFLGFMLSRNFIFIPLTTLKKFIW